MRTPTERPRCTAHRKNGERCKQAPIRGAKVCRTHGGAAPQVRKKAAERLEQAADRMAQQLLQIAEDKRVPAAVRLAAIRDALDRAGLHRGAEITVAMKPWQEVFERVMGEGTDVEIEVVDDSPAALAGDPQPLRLASQRVDQNHAYAMGSPQGRRR